MKDLVYTDGLIPAIIRDADSKEVLMLAYMNEESLRLSMEEGRTCFYSRSRKTLWRKGETSGHVQKIRSIQTDCDRDTLLIDVEQTGPACHTGAKNCFFNTLLEDEKASGEFSYDALYEKLTSRKLEKKEGSYTTYLFEKGTDKILKKVGEECTEVIIAAKGGDTKETVFEIADLVYHVTVLMIEQGITPQEIRRELASRDIVDVKVKQETMQ